MIPLAEKIKKVLPDFQKELGLKNLLAAPRIQKVVISVRTGRTRDKRRLDLIADRLAKITGQKAAPRGAKKSIASFKVRQGEVIGFAVTLRGKRLYGFLDKLLNAVIPRIRDFRGLSEKSVDETGNLTIGIREHNVFPEAADEELKDLFGLAVTIVTTARDRESALKFFKALGLPFSRSG